MAENIKQEQRFCSDSLKESLRLKRLQKKDKSYNRWKETENYAYLTYLKVCRAILEDPSKRKSLRIFRHMSKLIPTRTHQQIKSHHQKMMCKYGSIDEILAESHPEIKHYVSQSAENRNQVQRIAAVIAQFLKEQNCTKKFRDLQIVAVWSPDYKSAQVKIEDQSQKIMIEQEELGYILYDNAESYLKEEHREHKEQHKEEHNEQLGEAQRWLKKENSQK